uniref:Opsin n=1 Tax=Branchinella kugenumaensis TaxID=381660 RepID=B6EUX0_9CRUS|nr:opsin [Branchinella kugenumaensis]
MLNNSEPSFAAYSVADGIWYPAGTKQIDGAPADVIAMTHAHWKQFPPSNPAWNYLFGVIYFFLWIVNHIGNGLVIWIFLKTKSLRTPSNMLIVNLAIADFFMMLTQSPLYIISAFTSRWWIWGHFWCRFYGYTGGITGIAAIFTMVFIGYDRYNVIVKGMNGTKITKGMAFIMILWTWIYANAFCLPAMLEVWGNFSPEGLLSTCSFDYLNDNKFHGYFYTMYIFTGAYCVPMLLLMFFYSQIVKAVWAHEASSRAQAKKMNVESLRSNADANAESAEMRIAKVALTNVLLWVCIWTPYAFVAVTGAFGNRQILTPLVAQLPSLICKMASCLNPLVYAISHPKYRQVLQKELPWFCIHEPEDKKSDATSVGSATTTATA